MLDLETYFIIKTYKVKNSLANFRKDWNKFLEIFRVKFPEISELTTLVCHACVNVHSFIHSLHSFTTAPEPE